MTTTAESKLILIIEDEFDLAYLLKTKLQERGYRVAIDNDGLSAIIAVQEMTPDLVILDLMLPRCHGLTVCRLMKLNLRTERIPVLMMSAMTSAEDQHTGFSLGAADYITKPFEMRELLERVDALVGPTEAGCAVRFRD